MFVQAEQNVVDLDEYPGHYDAISGVDVRGFLKLCVGFLLSDG